jgi:hypothetical protein
MAIQLTLGTPTFEVKDHPTSGVGVKVTVTNGPEAVDAHQTSLALSGVSTETSQTLADTAEPLNAFAAGESREVGAAVQLDPGTWDIFVTIQDAQGNNVAQSDSHSVTIPGPQHHKAQFADSSQLQFTIEPTHVHKDASTILVKVDYRLSCTGSVDILPGFPVAIFLTDSDGNEAQQIYHIEQGVRRGASEPKFLHVTCGDSKAGDTAKLTMIGDQGGAAQKEFNFTLTWKEDGTANVTPA